MAITSKALGINAKERRALQAVRDGLRAGNYVHVKNSRVLFGERSKPKEKPIFNMGVDFENWSCGTVGCIGGWMGIAMKMKPKDAALFVHSVQDTPLFSLFFPPSYFSYSSITPELAADAIDNFLDCGDPKWDALIKKRAA